MSQLPTLRHTWGLLRRVQLLRTFFHGALLHKDELMIQGRYSKENSLEKVDSGPLIGQRALITGGSRGIGFAIARELAKAGCSCVLAGRDTAKLREMQNHLPVVSDWRWLAHEVLTGDVKDREFWENIRRNYANLDILVNAAGITHNSLLIATDYETIDNVVNTNLLGTIYGCKAVLKNMVRRKGGNIINISSVLGSKKGGKGSAAYAASKAGVLGLTRAIAGEYGAQRIRVNAILPGYIQTDMTDSMTKEAADAARGKIPMKCFGTPEDIAHTALFLLANDYANGIEVTIDGGLSTL